MTTRHILIVDDEQKVAFFLSRALERSNNNYRVTIAQSGEEALKVFDQSPIDVLVTDLRMPGISGLELIRWAQASSPDTRTILITAYGNDKVKAQAHRLRASRYITKPFDIDQFTEAVQEALNPSKKELALADEQRLRDLLVSLLFHQLRVPLTYILSYAGLIAEQGQDKEWGEAIQQHTLQMKEALEDFTTLAEWSVGQIPGYLEEVNLQNALQTTVAQLTSLTIDREQTLEVNSTEDVTFTTDSWTFGVMLTALIASGLKLAPEGASVEVGSTRQEDAVTVSVYADYEPPASLNEPNVSLTVAQELAQASGGELRTESHPGRGLSLNLVLPADFPAPEKDRGDGSTQS